MGNAEQTSYRWKNKYVGMGIAEVRRLKILKGREPQIKTTSS
jgi:putative transposase